MPIRLIIFLLVVSSTVFSQEIFVGRVYDEDTRLPLSGVEIKLDTIVTSTNIAGYFQIRASTGQSIKATLDGYETLLIRVPKETKFAFLLKPIESPEKVELSRSFYRYVGEKINYPSEARRNAIHGLVTVYFEVDSLNRIIISEVLQPLGGGCSDEVVRVLSNAPGVWFDIKGRTKFVLPVRFRLGNTKLKDKPELPKPGIILLPEIIITAYSR